MQHIFSIFNALIVKMLQDTKCLLYLQGQDGLQADLPPIAVNVTPSSQPIAADLWRECERLEPPEPAQGIPAYEMSAVAGDEVELPVF